MVIDMKIYKRLTNAIIFAFNTYLFNILQKTIYSREWIEITG